MRTASLYTDAASGTLRQRHIRFTVVKGPDAGVSATIEGGTMMVGTHANCDLRLSDATVSRYHLELELRADGVKVTDLETTNGTAHGDIRLGSVVLTGPARLRLGKTTEVEITPADEVVELSLYPLDHFGAVLGATPPMRLLFALAGHVAASDVPVLLEGEPGTGKQLLALALHRHSTRATLPFVPVGCATLARDRVAAELFGGGGREGLVEAAEGDSLFLEDVGELPADVQVELARVLGERTLRGRPLDVRVLASTRRDLRANGFRGELWSRLAVVRATLPALRHRRDDVPVLVHEFVTELGPPGFAVSPELVAELRAHDWPGNVAGLRRVIERGLVRRAASEPPADPEDRLAWRLEREYNAYLHHDD